MYKLIRYKKNEKIILFCFIAFIIIMPIINIIFNTIFWIQNYPEFRPSITGEQSIYTIDQLMARWFIVFTNWWGVYSSVFGILFLIKLKASNQKSVFDNWFFNPIFWYTYSIIVFFGFWIELIISLIIGSGHILENQWPQTLVTIIYHLVPLFVFVVVYLFAKYENLTFNSYLKKKSYCIWILPAMWAVFAWSRMAIYIYVHGFDKNEVFIMWFTGYNVLNPFVNPALAIGLLVLGLVVFWGIGTGLAWLITYLKRKKVLLHS